MSKGKIVQVMGPVVDVVFEDGDLRISKMLLKLKTTVKNVLWKFLSIWEMMWFDASC